MTAVDSEEAVARAAEVFPDLVRRLPGKAMAEIDTILGSLPIDPRTSDAEAAWSAIWNKPLYARTTVENGDRWMAQLGPHMAGAWRTWGADTACFYIEQRREASGVKKNGRRNTSSIYTHAGTQAAVVRRDTTVALHRLYAIQNAAGALRARSRRAVSPVSDFWDSPLDRLIPSLQAEFGWGWGPTTVVHMLTDFGVAIKTDRHVLRSLRALRLWTSDRDLPSSTEVIALNGVVKKLCRVLGELSPRTLRRLDVQLMAISRYGVLPA